MKVHERASRFRAELHLSEHHETKTDHQEENLQESGTTCEMMSQGVVSDALMSEGVVSDALCDVTGRGRL